jgi:hypothetical protein
VPACGTRKPAPPGFSGGEPPLPPTLVKSPPPASSALALMPQLVKFHSDQLSDHQVAETSVSL